ncbi:DUF3017 domain-containing protein [Amycolatopsis sp. CA-230715]|uniref:DUF3017 domain-containing protein n=1 Tax=Amycolatopsis sp. CA-230715 TaxID=2745196 RepID=UPI001C03941C|nr:DUF3017 domain-containing protein [Amycolatopsis sp. CA-230715]QWF79498.1 hypothetical protein HUW46_02906 [Amycolatopsis sp. CA-230715]
MPVTPRGRKPYLTHLPFGIVLALVAIAGWRIWLYHWRQGVLIIGGALLVAAVLRVVLADSQAGLLAIRGKPVDALSYAGLGVLILFIAFTISGGPLT